MPRTQITLNLNHDQKLAVAHLRDHILFVCDEMRDQIPNEVWSNIWDGSAIAFPDEEGWLDDGGYLVLKEQAEYYLNQAGYFVEPNSGNVRYLITNLEENHHRIWSLEILEKKEDFDLTINEDQGLSEGENTDELSCTEHANKIELNEMAEDSEFIESEDICVYCGGTGKVIINSVRQSMSEANPIYVFDRSGEKHCPSCHGTGRHLGIIE